MNIIDRQEFAHETVAVAVEALKQRYSVKELGATATEQLLGVLDLVSVPEVSDGFVELPETTDENTLVIPMLDGEQLEMSSLFGEQTAEQAKRAEQAYAELGIDRITTKASGEETTRLTMPHGADGHSVSLSSRRVEDVHGSPQVLTVANRPVILLGTKRSPHEVAGNLAHEAVHYAVRYEHPVQAYGSTEEYTEKKLKEEFASYHAGAVVEAHLAGQSLWKLIQQYSRGRLGGSLEAGVNVAMEGLRYSLFGTKGKNYRAEAGMLAQYQQRGLPILHGNLDVDGIIAKHEHGS